MQMSTCRQSGGYKLLHRFVTEGGQARGRVAGGGPGGGPSSRKVHWEGEGGSSRGPGDQRSARPGECSSDGLRGIVHI